MSTRSIGFLALGVVGVSLASTLMLLRSDSVEAAEESVQAPAIELRAESDSDSAPGSGLERLEAVPREGRVPASEDRPRGTESAGRLVLGGSAGTGSTYPVALRTLPESSVAEMTKKRDAIQDRLTELSHPILEQRFQDGKFERVPRGKRRNPEQVEQQHSDISSTRVHKSHDFSLNVDRTTLPRSEYPDLYVLKDEVERLDRSIQERALVELRALPESNLTEMTLKRDAIQRHLGRSKPPRTTPPRSEHLDLSFLKDEVERLNRSIQERAIADYYERKAEQAMEASR